MQKLFVYGTLAPGRPNEHLLQKIGGSWEKGYVIGKFHNEGWGATMGYPAVKLDDGGDKVHGYIFTSDRLAAYWSELDTFEGDAYQRVKTTVILADGMTEVEAFIYELKGG